MDVETLIEEMQKVKADHQTLELQDILQLFAIKAMQDLARKIAVLRFK